MIRSKSASGRMDALAHIGWWLWLALALVYAGFAIAMAVGELLQIPMGGHSMTVRKAPGSFIIHSVSGSIALLLAPLQVRTWKKLPVLHRRTGYVYCAAVLVTCIASLWTVVFFEIGILAKVMFYGLAVCWPTFTFLAAKHAIQGDYVRHAANAVRSVSLSLFFFTFSVWQPLLSRGLERDAAYAVSVMLSWGLNLLIAEVYIRARIHDEARLAFVLSSADMRGRTN